MILRKSFQTYEVNLPRITIQNAASNQSVIPRRECHPLRTPHPLVESSKQGVSDLSLEPVNA